MIILSGIVLGIIAILVAATANARITELAKRVAALEDRNPTLPPPPAS